MENIIIVDNKELHQGDANCGIEERQENVRKNTNSVTIKALMISHV
jgi:hypothetical protein